jgi:hypothetical protein
MKSVISKTALSMVALATPLIAQDMPSPSAAVVSPKPVGIIGAPVGTGAYPAVAESDATMRMNTLYHPAKMPANMPLILWGNGGCKDDGLNDGAFLREVSSHGFFIVAAGYPRVERGIERRPPPPADGTVRRPPPPPMPRPAPAAGAQRQADPTVPAQLISAIDWVERENANPKSRFYKRVNVTKIGVMGHSCGGLQAVSLAADPRVSTTILFNSGVLNDGPASGMSGMAVVKSELAKIHGPIAYINGGPTDVAYKNALDDFERIKHVPVFFGENGVGHPGTFWSEPNGGEYAQVAAAWMAWRLKGDAKLGKWFTGADCQLCTNPRWKVKKKAMQ